VIKIHFADVLGGGVSNGSRLPGFGLGLNQTQSPSPGEALPSKLKQSTSIMILLEPDTNLQVVGRVGTR